MLLFLIIPHSPCSISLVRLAVFFLAVSVTCVSCVQFLIIHFMKFSTFSPDLAMQMFAVVRLFPLFSAVCLYATVWKAIGWKWNKCLPSSTSIFRSCEGWCLMQQRCMYAIKSDWQNAIASDDRIEISAAKLGKRPKAIRRILGKKLTGNEPKCIEHDAGDGWRWANNERAVKQTTATAKKMYKMAAVTINRTSHIADVLVAYRNIHVKSIVLIAIKILVYIWINAINDAIQFLACHRCRRYPSAKMWWSPLPLLAHSRTCLLPVWHCYRPSIARFGVAVWHGARAILINLFRVFRMNIWCACILMCHSISVEFIVNTPYTHGARTRARSQIGFWTAASDSTINLARE